MNQTTLKGAGLAGLALIAAFATAQDVRVTVNGDPVYFAAAQPQMMGGRVLVPLRGVFERMGSTVLWDPVTRTVTANGDAHHVRLQIGSMDASVDGRIVPLDVPPTIYQGSTMVPLRFLSESLGATVDWLPQSSLVAIHMPMGAAQRFVPDQQQTVIVHEPPVVIERPVAQPWMITHDMVIPLLLDEKLTSDHAEEGQTFTASVRSPNGPYLQFPAGTVVEGYVREATPASGSHGGVLDLRFTTLRFPNGHAYPVEGIVRKLDDPNIVRTSDGRFVAKEGSDNNIVRDAAIGAGAGLVIGSIQGKAVGGAVIGGLLGAIVGALDKRMAHNVIFDRGTQFGLILDQDLAIDRRDLIGQ